ncbi:MAG TPA: NAD(P)/FAD-dependent oxidoreductase [Methanoregula sp.]|nr:NAD(P)/FAD-dependent oxidoreductase [Methanoregula sp.]
MDQYDVVVIGAGPAGLFCALQAGMPGHRILLLEKNKKPGEKLLLSGSGQCNITHDGEIREFLSHYGDQGNQVKPALFGFSNRDLIAFFNEHGLPLISENNDKVFPQTRRSADVLSLLVHECRERGVILKCNEPVHRVNRTTQGFEITSTDASYNGRMVVITTGGMSYPQTGSTGDGYRFSEALGQPLIRTAPALTPLKIRNYPFSALSGISFESMRFTIWRSGVKIADRKGDVLFTHTGLSGPGILDASRNIQAEDEIRLSFVGPLKREEFAADLKKRAEENRNWQLGTLLAAYPIPERLNRKLLLLSKIPPDLKCAHFSTLQRSKLIANCTEFSLIVSELGGFSIAMATRGGVALDGLNMKTMESRIIPGLYFAGEVLDIDGDTGGYNLQAAFSTGFLAAQNIIKNWKIG